MDLNDPYTEQSSVEHGSFQTFMALQLQAMLEVSRSIMMLLFKNMCQLDSYLETKNAGRKELTFWQRCLINEAEKIVAPGNERMKTIHDGVIATEEGHRLRPKSLRTDTKLLEETFGGGSVEKAN